jgi:hypothetical protein
VARRIVASVGVAVFAENDVTINYMRHNNAKEYLILLLTVTKFMLLLRRIEM